MQALFQSAHHPATLSRLGGSMVIASGRWALNISVRPARLQNLYAVDYGIDAGAIARQPLALSQNGASNGLAFDSARRPKA